MSASDVWLTPPTIITALGGPESFDLDPCASIDRPWDTAKRHYTVLDDGLAQTWDPRERHFVNPPYSAVLRWVRRIVAHGNGTALLFAKTETQAFMSIFDSASALFFLEGRVRFHLPNGEPGPERAMHPSVLCAWGEYDADVLAACALEGRFLPLRLPRRFAGAAVERKTWREAVTSWLSEQDGPVTLAALYRAIQGTPTAAGNAHPREKLRQTLQRGPFKRVGRGLWEFDSAAA